MPIPSTERISDASRGGNAGSDNHQIAGAVILDKESQADWKSTNLKDFSSITHQIPGLDLIEVTDGTNTLLVNPTVESFLPGSPGDAARMRATSNVCTPENEQKTIMVNGIETVVNSITPYGNWLKDLAEDALNEPMPDAPPKLEKGQQDLVDAAAPLAKAVAENLEAMAQGKLDPLEMRKNFKALQELFLNRMAPEELKVVCDAINMELAKAGKEWMRISIAESSGEIWLGALSGQSGKFTPVYEVRNKTGCPAMPE